SMEDRNIYENISPLDHRYYIANKEIFSKLSEYLSEEASIRYCLKVEIALLKTHINRHLDNFRHYIEVLVNLENKIDPDEVYREEEKTRHNIRALVNVINRKLPPELQPFVHLGATSADILDTAVSLRIKDAFINVVQPLLIDVENELIRICAIEAETPQVGRTHGQHAVPITFGFALAEYVSRLGKSILELKRLTGQLKGKLAGAVGAYNAMSLIVKDPEEIEKEVMSNLGLEPSEYSTQLIEPEYLLRLLLEMNVAFGILANLADDLRHLQRSEIGELKESYTKEQVGSSTMPQKRNPWNSEHIKSLWKAFAPRVLTFYMDQISEHQRDLTNSASSRFVADYIAGFSAAAARMKQVLSSLYIDRKKMYANLYLTKDMLLSEAAYILLSISGIGDAHEKIKQITLACEKNGISLLEALGREDNLWRAVTARLAETPGLPAEDFFTKPELYRGKAVQKALALAAKYKLLMEEFS
ncbi:MAG: lyase family protein, partial [Spirochaetota bacterium]